MTGWTSWGGWLAAGLLAACALYLGATAEAPDEQARRPGVGPEATRLPQVASASARDCFVGFQGSELAESERELNVWEFPNEEGKGRVVCSVDPGVAEGPEQGRHRLQRQARRVAGRRHPGIEPVAPAALEVRVLVEVGQRRVEVQGRRAREGGGYRPARRRPAAGAAGSRSGGRGSG